MINKILIMFLFVLVFFLGLVLGAGAIEYDNIERKSKEEKKNGGT